jgi:hypothetical protein
MWIRRLSELAVAGWFGLVAADARAGPPSPDEGLAEHRERFKQGMDLYEHGAPAEAIALWEPIYRDLGESRGYRLAYDLGLAYGALDDGPRSADRLQAFLNEVDARRARGEPLGAALTKEESDARDRLGRLTAVLGRVLVLASDSGRSLVRVDAGDPRPAGTLAWVPPGEHAVTFAPGTPAQRTITVEAVAGGLVELVAPPAAATQFPAATTPAAPAGSPGPAAGRPMEAPSLPRGPAPPLPAALLGIGGGATLAATVAAVALEIHASALRDDDVEARARSADGAIPGSDRASFAAARTRAYVAVGSAVGLGALSTGLAAWYLVARSRDDAARPTAAMVVRLGASRVWLEGAF